jgi:hypothetical protein
MPKCLLDRPYDQTCSGSATLLKMKLLFGWMSEKHVLGDNQEFCVI